MDRFAEKYAIFSSYHYAANNPIKYIDINGDSLRIVGNIKEERLMSSAFEIIERTSNGSCEFMKYANSSSHDVYIGFGNSKKNVAAFTAANLKQRRAVNGGIVKLPEKDLSEALEAFQGLDVTKSKGSEVSILGISIRNIGKLDKYDFAFAIFHELNGHISNYMGNDKKEHKAFGNTSFAPGLSLKDNYGQDFFEVKSEAWNFVQQLLELKVENGDASKRNKLDLERMRKEQ